MPRFHELSVEAQRARALELADAKHHPVEGLLYDRATGEYYVRVGSASRPGSWYEVVVDAARPVTCGRGRADDGTLRNGCPAYAISGRCSHMGRVIRAFEAGELDVTPERAAPGDDIKAPF